MQSETIEVTLTSSSIDNILKTIEGARVKAKSTSYARENFSRLVGSAIVDVRRLGAWEVRGGVEYEAVIYVSARQGDGSRLACAHHDAAEQHQVQCQARYLDRNASTEAELAFFEYFGSDAVEA